MDKEEKQFNKCPICGRSAHKESKYCIFHAKEKEKTEEEFKKALKEYIQEIKEKDKDYDFKGFIFIGDIDFKKDLSITVFKDAEFVSAIFKGYANFVSAIFEGYTNFWGATFKGYAGFRNTTLKGDAIFENAKFKGYADFVSAIFEGYTNFWRAIFQANANFVSVTFKANAGFFSAIFEGYADFRNTTIKGDANFENTTFKGYVGFKGVTFEGDMNFEAQSFVESVSFSEVNVSPGKKLYLKVENNRVNVYFERAYLQNAYLYIDLAKDVLVDFADVLLKNTKIEKDKIENHILQEEMKEYFQAQQVYLILKNNFHSIGQYEDESWAFKKEKDMERLSQSFPYYKATLKNENKKESLHILKWIQKGNFKKWILSLFSNLIYGYGERPQNVIFSAGIIIFIFALLFSLIGIGNPEIIELKGTAILQNSGNIVDLASEGFLKNNPIRNFPDSLYFSTITFTTLGYGDFRPLEGWGRIFAGSEAFIGAFMMALFVYTFARRTGGR